MMKLSIGRALLAVGTSAAVLSPALVHAHHSYAMFDAKKKVPLEGTVRLWDYKNPHSTLWLYVRDKQNKNVLYGLEAPATNVLLRQGFTRATVKPGDKVKVVINPLKDGRPGGNLDHLVTATGDTLNLPPLIGQ